MINSATLKKHYGISQNEILKIHFLDNMTAHAISKALKTDLLIVKRIISFERRHGLIKSNSFTTETNEKCSCWMLNQMRV